MAASRKTAVLKAEAERGDAPTTITLKTRLGSAKLRVLNPLDWTTEAVEAGVNNRFELWAVGALFEADLPKWQELKPTVRDAMAFSDAWGAAVGVDAGKPLAS